MYSKCRRGSTLITAEQTFWVYWKRRTWGNWHQYFSSAESIYWTKLYNFNFCIYRWLLDERLIFVKIMQLLDMRNDVFGCFKIILDLLQNYKELFGNEHESSPPLSPVGHFKFDIDQQTFSELLWTYWGYPTWMFNYLVLPILIYGCEIWGYENIYIRQITPLISKIYIVRKTIDINLHGARWNRSFPIIPLSIAIKTRIIYF